MISLFNRLTSVVSPDALNGLAARREMRRLSGVFPDGLFPAGAGGLCWGWLEDHLIRRADSPEDFRFYLKGQKIDPRRFELIGPDGGLHVERVRGFLASGLTVIFNHLEKSSDSFWEDVVRFEQALGAAVSIDAIGSYGTAHGLKPHYDNRDLLIVQIAGRKRWTILGEPLEGPWVVRDGGVPQTVTDEFVMQSGDVLFVPAGLCHQCFPLEPSLHLGVLIRRPCGASLLDLMQQQWGQDPALADRLFLTPEETDLSRQDAALKQALIRLIQATDTTALARIWLAQKQRPRRSGLPDVG